MYHKEESDCAWIYVYNDAGDLLYEAGFGAYVVDSRLRIQMVLLRAPAPGTTRHATAKARKTGTILAGFIDPVANLGKLAINGPVPPDSFCAYRACSNAEELFPPRPCRTEWSKNG